MKNSITVVVLVVLLGLHALSAAFAQDKDKHDFRKTRWGMSPAQVKVTEESTLTGQGPLPPYDLALSYEGSFEGLDAEIGYMFNADKLVLAGYAFPQNHTDNDLYVKDYEKVKAAHTKKYGPPVQDTEIWTDETKKVEPNEYGNAAAEGALVLQSSWSAPQTYIFLTLKGDGGRATLSALYYSSELNPLAIEKKFRDTTEGY